MARTLIDLDVRDILRKKEEPFQHIMQAVEQLTANDVLQLHTTFEPTPLLRVLSGKGYTNTARKMSDDHFIIQFYHSDSNVPYWHMDNRALQPPEPMIRSLELLEEKKFLAGEWGLEIWNERVPALLLPELDERSFQYDIEDEGANTVVVRIHR